MDLEAAPITWATKGAFETCLETSLDQWVRLQAEREVNEHPAAAKLDDAAVVAWTVDTITACRGKAQGSDKESEARFVSHMAHWRQHIYEVASAIRKAGQSD